MKTIYSKKNPEIILAIVTGYGDFKNVRTEVVPETEFLQSALLRLNEGDRFKPHKHIWKEPKAGQVKTQEAWIVLRGVIKANIYDTDDTLLESFMIGEGGVCFTIHGGHTLESLEDFTFVIEIKNGPYEGRERDKLFI